MPSWTLLQEASGNMFSSTHTCSWQCNFQVRIKFVYFPCGKVDGVLFPRFRSMFFYTCPEVVLHLPGIFCHISGKFCMGEGYALHVSEICFTCVKDVFFMCQWCVFHVPVMCFHVPVMCFSCASDVFSCASDVFFMCQWCVFHVPVMCFHVPVMCFSCASAVFFMCQWCVFHVPVMCFHVPVMCFSCASAVFFMCQWCVFHVPVLCFSCNRSVFYSTVHC